MKAGEKSLKIVNLDHLGIIAGIIDEMELVEEVNKKVGVSNKEKVSPGQVMKAMIRKNGRRRIRNERNRIETWILKRS